ncbi:hypothetical protein [Aquimarina spongiae]|uniref:Beta-lactamase-inhibitor-like, PepSY-like n=1 Tax=Aquimarina spongiae TaxID=570521 RepID=A0A1M6L3B8_9FLAO|nr:hypothetical protein [Aquimarina spongiae]SHJ65676.1 hypothetical protein SAMN04488508_11389 [Aquimarina spongiae]
MKKLPLLILFLALMNQAFAQIGPNDANALMGLPTATDLTEINAIINPQIGSVVFNLDDEEIYRYTGATNGWQVATDDQTDAEVPLAIPIDVDEDAVSTPTNETTLQEVVQAIAPITSKAGRVFFPPSIEIDASAIINNQTIDLYALYRAQYATPVISSPSAPNTIPIYEANELYYYVTFADPVVFNIDSLSDAGVLQYDILSIPTDDNTIINVVFVVR